MFDDLEFFLSQRCSEYRTAMLLTAAEHAYDILGTKILDNLNDLLFSVNELDTDDALDVLGVYLKENLVAGLAEFGVQIAEDADSESNLSVLNDLASALTIADCYEDPNRLIALASDAGTSEEAFADIVEEITGQNSDIVLELVASVDRDLVSRIVEENVAKVIAMESSTIDPNAADRSRDCIERLKRSEFFNRDGFVESRLVVSRLYGEPTQTLVESMGTDFYDLRGDTLAQACYQIACASSVATNAVIGTAKQILEAVLDDEPQERQRLAFLMARYPIPTVEV